MVANEAKHNKDKLAEYQKKMATLNMEINLTQNLYNTFLDAKSRLKKGIQTGSGNTLGENKEN
jgi:hypothetical protein